MPETLIDDLTASWVAQFRGQVPAMMGRMPHKGFDESLYAAWRPLVARWATSPDFVKPPAESSIIQQASQAGALSELSTPKQSAPRNGVQRMIQRQPPFAANQSATTAALDELYGLYDPLRDPAIHNRASSLVRAGQTPPDLFGKVSGYVVTNALLPAIKKTRFYQRFETWGSNVWRRRWPWIVGTLAASATAVTLPGMTSNNWRPTAETANLLPYIPAFDINLGVNHRLQMMLKLSDESLPIRDDEEGVVIGLNPRLGFRYKFPNGATLGIGGGVNMRFQTGQGSTQGYRFNAAPSGKVTFRWHF